MAAVAQLFATVTELMEISGLHLKDLAAMPNTGPMVAMAQHLVTLVQQIENERQIIMEIQRTWGLLVDEGSTICTAELLRALNVQGAMLQRQMIVSTLQNSIALIRQTSAIIQTLVQMASLYGLITGSVAGLQVMISLQTTTNGYLSQVDQKLLVLYTTMTMDGTLDAINRISMSCLQEKRLADWGTMRPR